MPSIARLLRVIAIAGVLVWTACGGKGKTTGAGGVAGGGTSGSDGGAPITSCPSSMPTTQPACSGALTCQFEAGCTCHGCCVAFYSCVNGTFKELDFNDVCIQGPPCEDGGAGDAAGSGGAVCTFGADQTCNDNPALSSIHGRCTDAGVCACSDAGVNPDSGRCL